jgi:AcrR family transcriptional regulator
MALTDPAPQSAAPATRGRPRDEALNEAIIVAAEHQLRHVGYARMSLRSVAEAAGTTVPSLLRRYADKATLATAVVDSLRVDPLIIADASPRDRALALLMNFDSNLRRPNSIALLSTLLTEERATPQLIARFRARLAEPRRQALRQTIEDGIASGDLARHLDADATAAMLIGSFYARYISHGSIPPGWPSTVLEQLWPAVRSGGL